MPPRSILRFPDPRLRVVAERVEAFDDSLRSLAADLLDSMRAARGIGITAPHVGIPKRVVVIQLDAAHEVLVCVNPRIVWSSAETARHTEGSVSMPGVTDEIERPARVRVQYQDEGGVERTVEAESLLAVCLQHEIDQLDGMFWIYRLSRLKRDRLAKRYLKLSHAAGA